MTEPNLMADERLDDLQLASMCILQKKQGFRFGMDAVLLADFAQVDARAHVVDFGTGTGILPLLLTGRGKGAQFDALECQQHMANMAARTVALNGLEESIHIHHAQVEQALDILPSGTVDAIVCNPPYGISGTTLVNPDEARRVARHQQEGGLEVWFRVAQRLLRGRGKISMIYPAPRMLQAMEALQAARLAPKRFRLVYPRVNKPANLVLIEAMKDARPMLHPEPPLIVYTDDGQMTDELRRIYHVQPRQDV